MRGKWERGVEMCGKGELCGGRAVGRSRCGEGVGVGKGWCVEGEVWEGGAVWRGSCGKG